MNPIKTVKEWWAEKNKPTSAATRNANPANLKVGIDTIKEANKRKKQQLDEITKSM